MHFEYILKWVVALFLLRSWVGLWIKPTFFSVEKKALALPLFISIWAYFYWILASGFSASSAWFFIGLSFFFAHLCLLKKPVHIFETLRPHNSFQVKLESLIFWGTLGICLYMRAQQPEMGSGEKYSDMSIFQAVLLDPQFPPMDRWLAGYPLNYYYFSHLLFVPLVKLLHIPPEWAVNLIVCTVPALLTSSAYGLLRQNKIKPILAGLAAFFLFYIGNWEWMRWALGWSGNAGGFWWWDSSRAIPNTITEFPLFSFFLGDMHAHYVSLCFVSISLALMLRIKQGFASAEPVSKILLFFIMPVSLGMHYMLNSWHLPFMVILALLCFWSRPKYLMILLALAGVYFAPFWLHYTPPKNTIGLFYVMKSMRSPLPDFLFHWAPFFCIWLLIATHQIASKGLVFQKQCWKQKNILFGGVFVGFLLLAWVFLGATPAWMVLFFYILYISGMHTEIFHNWAVGVLVLSLLTIIGCEFISVDVTYGVKYYRLNTVFKFYYLAWWGLAISLPVLLQQTGAIGKKYVKIGLCMVLLLSLYYPYQTSKNILNHNQSLSLDGMRAWPEKFPQHRMAVDWLRNNTAVNDVIWEVPGGGFSDYSRMATFSGRPSVLGWFGHQQIWREGGFFLAQERKNAFNEVNLIPSMTKIQQFIARYEVDWIIVGDLERKDYSPELLALIDRFPLAFETSLVRIYQAR